MLIDCLACHKQQRLGKGFLYSGCPNIIIKIKNGRNQNINAYVTITFTSVMSFQRSNWRRQCTPNITVQTSPMCSYEAIWSTRDKCEQIQVWFHWPMAWYLGDIVVGWCNTKISASNSQVAWGISFGETITMPFLIVERLIWDDEKRTIREGDEIGLELET